MTSIVMEEYELLGDSKYRSYMSLVDKALKAFEYTTEWADLIAALGKLNKVLVAHTKYPIIPRRIVISKRLAQCMHPALPSGVHIKALETYDIIFKCMGTNRLAQELFLYSAGLFPLLGNAAMHVRPKLLTVYETHFVPLGERLRPALNGFLSGVLPGLEEGSDHFARTNRLLESVCDAASAPVFYGALWQCIAANPLIRLPAILFILQHVDKKTSSIKDQPHLHGTDVEVMVRAIVEAVQDSNILVQRHALDLLIGVFPLHEKFLEESDITDILTAACCVLLRRDMSLNRRLFNWLLGNEVKVNASKSHARTASVSSTASNDSKDGSLSFYFDYYSKGMLIDALRAVLRKSLESRSQPNLKPYRLMMTLLDKPEIGPPILDLVIIDIFRTLYHSYNANDKFKGTDIDTGKQELIKGANLLFGTFEPHYIWEFCGSTFESASKAEDRINDSHNEVNNIGKDDPTVIEMCALIDFLLDVVSVETCVEAHSKYIPELFKKVAQVVTSHCDQLSAREVTKALTLAKKLLSRVQPAWNAWDAQESASVPPSEHMTEVSSVKSTDEDKATEMWTEIGKDVTRHKSPELATEATETMPESSPDEPPRKMSSGAKTAIHQQHEALMSECASKFEALFVRILQVKVFTAEFDMTQTMNQLIRRPKATLEDRTRNLEHLLDNNAKTDDATLDEIEEEATIEKLRSVDLPLKDGKQLQVIEEALAMACQILIDLSSIPTVSSRGARGGSPGNLGCSPSDLPDWLQLLLISSCLLNEGHASFQLHCISTLLDLMEMLQSTMMVSTSSSFSQSQSLTKDHHQDDEMRSNIVIVMMPMIEEQHYQCIVKQTVVAQVIASRLWEGLGLMPPELHLRCVTLLHQLHNLVPFPKTVERILARSLGYGQRIESSSTVDAYQRFTLLWHLSRELESRGRNGKCRTFDICLLKMLDNLNLSSGPLKALSQSWLVHAMAKGDIARLMEPLFLTLLDPSTARVSVLHARIDHRDSVDSRDGEEPHHVYAISSSNKEVIYHVSSNKRKTSADKAKRVFALSSFRKQGPGDPGSSRSEAEGMPKKPFLSSSDLNNVSLLVNPFALVPPGLEEYNFYTKGYTSDEGESHDGPPSTSSSVTVPGDATDESSGTMTDSTRPSSSMSIAKLFGEDEQTGTNDSKETSKPKLPDADSLSTTGPKNLTIHALHSHLLLYCQVCDSRRILYTMNCIKNVIVTNPRLSICTLSTTNLSSAGSPRNQQIQMLLARHRKSVFGKNFAGPLSSENMATYRNSTLIEVLISTLLYYLRSYYPNLGQVRLHEEELQSNREVQLMSIDILSVLVSELVLIVQDNGNAYATYIGDLFARCKVQKVVLHSLLAGINDMRDSPKRKEEQEILAFTEDILAFNEVYSSHEGGGGASVSSDKISNYSEAFQVQVLRLLLSLIMLEQVIAQQRGEAPEKMRLSTSIGTDTSGLSTPAGATAAAGASNVLRYHNDHVIPDQPMFLAAIVMALRQEKMRHLHSHWTSLVTSCLPFLGRSLSQSVLEITGQLSRNLENLAPFYITNHDQNRTFGQIPADYVVTQLEALTMIYHFCLLESSAQVTTSFSQPTPQPSSSQQQSPGNQSEIFTNLLHVFLSNTDTKQLATKSLDGANTVDSLAIARKILLSTLPRLVSTVAILWKCLNESTAAKDASCVILVGSPRVVRSRLLDLLSPIAHHHPISFLSAIGVAWQELRDSPTQGMTKQALPSCNDRQSVLVEVVGAIKTMPVSVVIQTVRQVVKTPPSISGTSSKINVDVAVLQFFYAYLAQCSKSQVFESWTGLAGLLKECSVLTPPAIFLALSILNQFVHRALPLSERKEQKELQDIAGRLVEACANIGGSCLEQTNWLRRNLAVNAELLQETLGASADLDLGAKSTKVLTVEEDSTSDGGNKKAVTHYAVPALTLLGELLAPFLDIIFNSEEKEKVLPLLYNVMYNVIPYLKNHSKGNMASFRACSKLLASLSDYQYTRKAWKKDALELLLDPGFFQMDLHSLQYWRTIVDNLMTHDKTTFKELIAKVSSISQSGSLSLFSTKDQEMEQRALLLKRLAFVIFCSDEDQYQNQMPDIQERLTESLRSIPSPAVQSAVFLCFRVLIVRMSSHHVTSLWPLIITEMVQIFSYLEQELLTDSEETSSYLKRLSTLDSSWVVSAGANGLAAHNSPQWMALYLSVCKLLDLALALPASFLPQFQMYRWAFVSEGESPSRGSSPLPSASNVASPSAMINGGGGGGGGAGAKGPKGSNEDRTQALQPQHQQDFVPYVVRVAKLLLQKLPDQVAPASFTFGQPQLTMTSITSLEDLGPFFASICDNVTRQQTKRRHKQQMFSPNVFVSTSGKSHSTSTTEETMSIFNAVIERDFMEQLSSCFSN